MVYGSMHTRPKQDNLGRTGHFGKAGRLSSDALTLVSLAKEIIAKSPNHALANRIAVVEAYSQLLGLYPDNIVYSVNCLRLYRSCAFSSIHTLTRVDVNPTSLPLLERLLFKAVDRQAGNEIKTLDGLGMKDGKSYGSADVAKNYVSSPLSFLSFRLSNSWPPGCDRFGECKTSLIISTSLTPTNGF